MLRPDILIAREFCPIWPSIVGGGKDPMVVVQNLSLEEGGSRSARYAMRIHMQSRRTYHLSACWHKGQGPSVGWKTAA